MLIETGLIDRDGETFAFLCSVAGISGVYLSGHTLILTYSCVFVVYYLML
jgi:hypothetical protein